MKKELKKFRQFKQTYQFELKEICDIDGIKYCDGIPLKDEKDEEVGETDKWINVGYKIKGSYSKVLSNLFPYKFKFKGKELYSIESFFQGIKFKDIGMQNLVLKYSGVNAYHIKVVNEYDWRETGIVYWQGKPIDRFSKEYEDLVDELYISAIQNPLYRSALKKCNKYILHEMGNMDKRETVFTRYEFEKQLNCLNHFLKQ